MMLDKFLQLLKLALFSAIPSLTKWFNILCNFQTFARLWKPQIERIIKLVRVVLPLFYAIQST